MAGRPPTFRERHGHLPMPRQLRTNELTPEIRSNLWALVYGWLQSESRAYGASRYLEDEGLAFARSWWVSGRHEPLDEFPHGLKANTEELKQWFYASNFYPLFDFLEFALSSSSFPDDIKGLIGEVLQMGQAAWRVSDDRVVPVGSDEEAQAIGASLAEIDQKASSGVQTHLRQSAQALSAGKWADSARESLHAVEAAARAFDEKGTLGEIVKRLKVAGQPLHPALIKAISALYGYASDQPGIRHSLTDEADAAVDESEALLLYGLSVSFAQYLVRLKSTAS